MTFTPTLVSSPNASRIRDGAFCFGAAEQALSVAANLHWIL
jgi:hypothetical protein